MRDQRITFGLFPDYYLPSRLPVGAAPAKRGKDFAPCCTIGTGYKPLPAEDKHVAHNLVRSSRDSLS